MNINKVLKKETNFWISLASVFVLAIITILTSVIINDANKRLVPTAPETPSAAANCVLSYSIIPAPVPIKPLVNVSCPSSSPTAVTFSWTSVPNASYYYLRLDNTSNSWLANCETGSPPNPGDYCIGGITGTSYTINLPANSSYKWFVSAFVGSTQGAFSEWVSFSIPSVCTTTSTPTMTPTPKPSVTLTPTTTPVGQCLDVKLYSSNWGLLTSSQISNLSQGDQIYFCVRGGIVSGGGSYDSARFTINNTQYPETTLRRPGTTSEFCQNYTFPAGTYSFNIVAEIHHTILGWLR